MAKLRKWCAYRKIERPYTRWSKVRAKAFVKSRPGKKIIKYDMGDLIGAGKQFDLKLRLVSKDPAQIRTNALEAARVAALKRLEAKFGRMGFYFKIKVHPHQAIRENPLAAGAGADRLSTGMKHSFGKIIGTAAKVEEGKDIFEIYIPKVNENFGRELLGVASKKLPIRSTVVAEYKKAIKLTKEELEKVEAAANKRSGTQKEEAEEGTEEGAEATEGTEASATEEEKKEE